MKIDFHMSFKLVHLTDCYPFAEVWKDMKIS